MNAISTLWRPRFTLDLKKANPAVFLTLVDQFHEWSTQTPKPDLKLTDGWHVITPEIAEQLLHLNPVGANRKPSVASVFYYADQMIAIDWQETGQALIFSVDGLLLDGQHRLWACYLSGASFTTFVVNLRKEIPGVFAYIDNSRSRSIKDALFTAGLNGLSSVAAQVLDIEWNYVNNAYLPDGKKKVVKLSPKRALDYINAHPNIMQGVRLMAGEHAAVHGVIFNKDVAAFAAVKILDLHDEEVLDSFMGELSTEHDEGSADGSPVIVLQELLRADRGKTEQMKKHQVLGHVILAFNAWLEKKTVKKLTLAVAQPFPKFMGPLPTKQLAAE